MTEPTQASPARATVTMFVFNDVVHDWRVRKEAASLGAAGYDVTLIGRLRPGETLPPSERLDGFTLLRVPVPQNGDTLMTATRRPWLVRRQVLRTFRQSLVRPVRGWLRAAAMVVAAPLVAPWVAYRAAGVYLLRDPRPLAVARRDGRLAGALAVRHQGLGRGRRAGGAQVRRLARPRLHGTACCVRRAAPARRQGRL